MSNSIFGVTWGAVHNLIYVFPIILIILALLLYRVRRSRNAVEALTHGQFRSVVLSHFSLKKNWLKFFLFMMGVIGVSCALLHPQWNKKEQVVSQEGRDLFIMLDVSRSMLAKDCQPNRLLCAKNKIKELVRQLSSERVGLLLFSGSAFIQCPLTTDYAAFFMFLDAVDVESISSGSTAIDKGIIKVLDAFSSMQDRKNKLLVLFTDGEDFSSNLQAVKKRAHAQGLHIFTVGVGTQDGAPIPLFDAQGKQVGHQLDKKGSVVISRLNEGILSTLAHDVGGVYIPLSKDDTDIKTIVGQVTAFEKEKFDEKRFAALEEQYPYFLIAGFIFFVLEWLL